MKKTDKVCGKILDLNHNEKSFLFQLVHSPPVLCRISEAGLILDKGLRELQFNDLREDQSATIDYTAQSDKLWLVNLIHLNV